MVAFCRAEIQPLVIASQNFVLLNCGSEGQAFSHNVETGKQGGFLPKGVQTGHVCMASGPLPGAGMPPVSNSFPSSEEGNIVTCHCGVPIPMSAVS